LKPFKAIAKDLATVFLINTATLYGLLLVVPDTSVAMISAVWVGVMAWRGGLLAALLAGVVVFLSNFLAIEIPPNNLIVMQYYFNGRIPGPVMGVAQYLVFGSVVGYISTLVHRLRTEIRLRKKTERELEVKIAELNAFGRTVAHDLKNPLTVIHLSANLLHKEFAGSDNEKAKKSIGFINDGTKHMIAIIDSILVLAGIKKVDPQEFRLFPMAACVNDAVERLKHTIEAKKVEIVKPEVWPSVVGYAPWIVEVWVNYMVNAVKYGGNPAAGITPVVKLGYDRLREPGSPQEGGQVRFWVRDNGNGIEKEKTALLFREFSRLYSTDKEGHGLGLSIVKTVVEKSGGTVGVESDVGEGRCFYLTLPTTSEACA
jgi:signal transduction histidine kinase